MPVERLRIGLFVLGFGASLFGAAPVAIAAQSYAPQTAAAKPDSWVINLRDTEIRVFAEQVSSITGRTLILDPAVRGQVTVISAEPLGAEAVWELFQSVLRVNGFAALRAGSAWRIVPQASANQGGPPVDQNGGVASQNLITRLLMLHNLPSETASRALKPLVATFGYLEALPRPNAIIVTDTVENVRRIEELVRLLDRSDGSRVETIPLLHASAKTIAPLIERTLAAQGTTSGETNGPRVLADDRSNSLIVRADPAIMRQIRGIVTRLDEPSSGSLETRVFRLRHADAEDVTEVLKGLVGGKGASENPVANALQSDSGSGGDPASAAQNVLGQVLSPPSLLQGGGSSGSALGSSAGGYGGAGPGSSGGSPFGSSSGSGSIFGSNGIGGGSNGGRGSGSKNMAGFSTGDLAIQPDAALNAIVVRASPSIMTEIDQLIQELDVRRPQVLIEAAIVEITGDDAENFGIQLGFGAAAATQGGLGATSFSSSGVSISQVLTALGAPLAGAAIGQDGLTIGLSQKNQFALLVQALASSSKANLLSTPSLTTLDNEPAEIVVGQNVPFRTGSFTTSGNSTNPFTTIERQDVGITLKFVPRITEGDVIRLQVEQEVSSLVNSTVAGAADLITNKRDIQTTVLADNNQTIVLGGLISDDETSSKSRVPVLGDLPVVGPLFGSQQKDRNKRMLFVFLRPTILRDRVAVAAAANRDFERVRSLEAAPVSSGSLLLAPMVAKLPLNLEGIY